MSWFRTWWLGVVVALVGLAMVLLGIFATPDGQDKVLAIVGAFVIFGGALLACWLDDLAKKNENIKALNAEARAARYEFQQPGQLPGLQELKPEARGPGGVVVYNV